MSFTIAPTRLFSRSSKPVAASWRCSFSSTSRDHGLPPTLPKHERLSALSPKPLPSTSPSPLELLASQPSHYITCLLMGRRYTVTAHDVLTVPKLKSVRAGQRIALTRILEVGSRDYTLRAGPSPSSLPPARPTSAVSAKLSSFQPSTPLLRPAMARTIIDRSGVPRDWQRHPDSLPYFKEGEVKAQVLVLEHVKGKMFEVEKFKRRKGYRRTLRSKLEFTKLRVGDIILGSGKSASTSTSVVAEGEAGPKVLDTELKIEGEKGVN
ncbi:BZ3500_MvSof-1268-A1-R1_Chr11-1g03149 [Microbotryum saponariae]|uniref:Large ribosomal subunit protein bL21m n=1 Tax=Microbotryum saponariae TaxID=289078 RepID=A0A2X0LD76_9BASI|nr:BZ3501_MvSof-1269-A2-R1_Chr11g02724 [Microbotryum saponariae]SDA03709.1 BZ3500_MvSof-1268-A1-R1_Chr11-1g03149 [Microbotryum saponariae]